MRALLVEDDKTLGEGIRVALRSECYTLGWFTSGMDAEHALRSEQFDLILLDLGLPRLGGLELLSNIRQQVDTNVPVLVLTAQDEVSDRIQALDAGADDYLIKPFDIDELKARIRALLRRSQGRARPLLEHAGISLELACQEVRYHGQVVSMTSMEFRLLYHLLARPGVVVTRERLCNTLYGWKEVAQGNTLEVLIHNLRKKLYSSLIRTVRGVGYLVERSS
ncbi:response regulator [Ectopseudomonas mendocina]|uniref:Response regulator n=1 Tax=Ectopseudomonas mendocina TaxID=300 RepID=A0ABZ2REQ3_ECTME